MKRISLPLALRIGSAGAFQIAVKQRLVTGDADRLTTRDDSDDAQW
jgi:hypothetical protein